MSNEIDLITMFIAFFVFLLVLIQYLAYCMELKSCLEYFDIDTRFVYVPVYNTYLYLQLGDDYEDGMLTVTDKDRIPRKVLFGVYCAFVGILLLFVVLDLAIEPFLFPLLIVLLAVNLSVSGTAYGVYFYEGFTLDDNSIAVIASSMLGALPFLYIGRFLILRRLLKVCKYESDYSEG